MHILKEASNSSLKELTSDVNRTAQPFFERFGFTIVERRQPKVLGVVIPNAYMRLKFPSCPTPQLS
jgi:putative acetyltransferase